MMRRRSLLVVPALGVVGGCGGGPPPPPVVNLTIQAGRDLNSSRSGTPLSVAVRLYTLNSRARFATADAYALMDRESAVLGTEGTRAEEIVMRPGETRNITLTPKPDVRYLGVAVLFQDIDRARWRAVEAIAPSGVTKLMLVLGSNSAALETA